MMKLIPAKDIFNNEDWKLSKWQRFKINRKVNIICLYYKIKHWICE
jgi:hypothetical protein